MIFGAPGFPGAGLMACALAAERDEGVEVCAAAEWPDATEVKSKASPPIVAGANLMSRTSSVSQATHGCDFYGTEFPPKASRRQYARQRTIPSSEQDACMPPRLFRCSAYVAHALVSDCPYEYDITKKNHAPADSRSLRTHPTIGRRSRNPWAESARLRMVAEKYGTLYTEKFPIPKKCRS